METHAALTEYLYSRVNWSDWTRQWYTSRLTRFVEWARQAEGVADTTDLSAPLAHRFYGVLRAQGLASASIQGYGRGLRTFYGWLSRDGLLDERQVKRLEIPKADKKVKRTLEIEDFQRLFRAAERHGRAWEQARNVAILVVLADTGLRANELCTLRMDGVVLTPQEGYARILGKGRKEREVGLGRQARHALVRYMHRYRRAQPGVETVFVSRTGYPLSVNGLEKLMNRIAVDAQLDRKIYPHLFRHSYARHYLAQGGDAVRLSRLLGHEGVEITMHYLRDVRAAEARVGASILDQMTTRTTKGRER